MGEVVLAIGELGMGMGELRVEGKLRILRTGERLRFGELPELLRTSSTDLTEPPVAELVRRSDRSLRKEFR